MRYVAFFRAINVGGKNKITKTEQEQLFVDMGCKKVSGLLATGNIFFTSDRSAEELREEGETKLMQLLSNEVKLMIIPLEQVTKLVQKDPFANFLDSKQNVAFVSIVDKTFDSVPESLENSFGSFRFEYDHPFILSFVTKKKPGASPNSYFEKELHCHATTRNWNTIMKIVKKFG
ncbi:MAG: DUF1697 domain-containing protein [Candidatus Heimdallarchaeota archaeon]|nr:DUF1697 domain-containing protein [Candidatus Heimdallarchaeota archaeon]